MSSILHISESDHQRISELLEHFNGGGSDLLMEELDRAVLIADESVPPDLVTMNSFISCEDMDSGEQIDVQLVYPERANIDESRVSILAPVGAALIGLKSGQHIEWPLPNGKTRRLLVKRVQQSATGV